MSSSAFPGLFLCFAAMILLIIISSPLWDAVSFLDVVTRNHQTIHFGVWGYTGSVTRLGYHFNPSILGIPQNSLNNDVIHNLTFALILHPIAAGLAGLAVISGIFGVAYARSGTILMALFAVLATLVTLVAWVIDMILWGVARNRIRHAGAGATANYGNANWITLGALFALIFGFCAGSVGACGRYRRKSPKV